MKSKETTNDSAYSWAALVLGGAKPITQRDSCIFAAIYYRSDICVNPYNYYIYWGPVKSSGRRGIITIISRQDMYVWYSGPDRTLAVGGKKE